MVNKQAEEEKDKGNEFFKQKKYKEAIKLDPKTSVYHSNRATACFILEKDVKGYTRAALSFAKLSLIGQAKQILS